jgi:hypothetical protein
MKGGNHCDHLDVSFIKAKTESLGGVTFVAREIRTLDGMSNEMAVTTKNKNIKLSIASLINLTL